MSWITFFASVYVSGIVAIVLQTRHGLNLINWVWVLFWPLTLTWAVLIGD